MPTAEQEIAHAPQSNGEAVLQQIRDALAGLKFGVVTVVVQDGVVVQLERTEKHRLRGPK